MKTPARPRRLLSTCNRVEEVVDRLIARKTVSMSLAEPYDFIPSLLASRHVDTSNTSPLLSSQLVESTIWCILLNHVRTHFSKKYVL